MCGIIKLYRELLLVLKSGECDKLPVSSKRQSNSDGAAWPVVSSERRRDFLHVLEFSYVVNVTKRNVDVLCDSY